MWLGPGKLSTICVALLLSVTLAGCGSRPAPAPSSVPDAATPRAFGVMGSGCNGYEAHIITPKGVFAPEYPPGVPPLDEVEISAFQFWTCVQATVGTQTIQNFQLAQLITYVNNPDPKEKDSLSRALILQVFTNARPLADNSAVLYGLPMAIAANATVTEG